MGRVGAYIALVRPQNVSMAGLGVIVGALATTGADLPWFRVGTAAAAAMMGVAGSNALNDAVDAKVDVKAHPDRPVARGLVTPRQAARLGLALLVLGVGAMFAVHVYLVLVATVMALLVLAYEFALKEHWLLGHAAVSFNVGLLFLLGGLSVAVGGGRLEEAPVRGDALLAPLFMGALATLLNFGREVLKAAEDAPFDVGARETFALRHGVSAARRTGTVVALLTIPAGFVPYALLPERFGTVYLAALAPLVVVLAAVPFLRSPAHIRATLKLAMWLGFLPFLATALI